MNSIARELQSVCSWPYQLFEKARERYALLTSVFNECVYYISCTHIFLWRVNYYKCDVHYSSLSVYHSNNRIGDNVLCATIIIQNVQLENTHVLLRHCILSLDCEIFFCHHFFINQDWIGYHLCCDFLITNVKYLSN